MEIKSILQNENSGFRKYGETLNAYWIIDGVVQKVLTLAFFFLGCWKIFDLIVLVLGWIL